MTTRINRRQFEALLKANPAVRAGSFVTLRWSERDSNRRSPLEPKRSAPCWKALISGGG